jgi:hypothetical protein
MVMQHPVVVSAVRTLTEMDVCGNDSVGIDRVVG